MMITLTVKACAFEYAILARFHSNLLARGMVRGMLEQQRQLIDDGQGG